MLIFLKSPFRYSNAIEEATPSSAILGDSIDLSWTQETWALRFMLCDFDAGNPGPHTEMLC